ncbi:hypothetical protein [Roseinatronobacter thiooxidans]|uniref:hypothetical protein n=1 Tax=Roseinatronobacter thiooxidans TaxID=121821 RepID=UPI0011609BBE|nr:hypothetical protein [Roseinatronobacter thiooxidans]
MRRAHPVGARGAVGVARYYGVACMNTCRAGWWNACVPVPVSYQAAWGLAKGIDPQLWAAADEDQLICRPPPVRLAALAPSNAPD